MTAFKETRVRALPERLLDRFRADPYARRMGFALLEAAPGYARVAVDAAGR